MQRHPAMRKPSNLSFRVPLWVKKELHHMFLEDGKEFNSEGDYIASLVAEVVIARGRADRIAKFQREAARAAERKVARE